MSNPDIKVELRPTTATAEPPAAERSGRVPALLLAAIGGAAAAAWLHFRHSEAEVDERTRRRLAPRRPQPPLPSSAGASRANPSS